ncbi:MAG: hypothetical protein U0Y68_07640 [Blastocatellia bacterium]
MLKIYAIFQKTRPQSQSHPTNATGNDIGPPASDSHWLTALIIWTPRVGVQ